ncbi:MAG TPA: hypothetical protein VGO45_09435 [Bacteroidia bacterium]|jgi:phage tail tape-measure protein|nr:hypothetical protein [Bacteroidia bacterium]
MENSGSITSAIVDGLRKTADELEAFRLQLTLGKADASDKFEEMKKELSGFVSGLKTKLNKIKQFGGRKAEELHEALDELQLQLALGKAEARLHFEIQEKKILEALQKIEKGIEKLVKKAELPPHLESELQREAAKARIKMEILRLRFKIKKMDAKGKMKDYMNEHIESLNKLAGKIKSAANPVEEKGKWKHFNEEMKEAYDHLKTAFSKL